jgi:hypothetical protein
LEEGGWTMDDRGWSMEVGVWSMGLGGWIDSAASTTHLERTNDTGSHHNSTPIPHQRTGVLIRPLSPLSGWRMAVPTTDSDTRRWDERRCPVRSTTIPAPSVAAIAERGWRRGMAMYGREDCKRRTARRAHRGELEVAKRGVEQKRNTEGGS